MRSSGRPPAPGGGRGIIRVGAAPLPAVMFESDVSRNNERHLKTTLRVSGLDAGRVRIVGERGRREC